MRGLHSSARRSWRRYFSVVSNSMLPEDREFITGKLKSIQGWLTDDAAYLTTGLMRDESNAGDRSGILEIGVFAGKYLSLLYHLSHRTAERVVGLDTFEEFPSEGVEENFRDLFGQHDRLTLLACSSSKVTADDLIARIGGKPRFVSVDGAHTSSGVLGDLNLTEEILAEGGLVAIDDILNPRAFGVSEGAYRYFISRDGKGLLPFAFCGNKLFACARSDLVRFQKSAQRFVDANVDLPMAENFRALLNKGPQWVEQELFGVPILIF